MAAASPWKSASEPSAAGVFLNHLVTSGIVTEVRGAGHGVT